MSDESSNRFSSVIKFQFNIFALERKNVIVKRSETDVNTRGKVYKTRRVVIVNGFRIAESF